MQLLLQCLSFSLLAAAGVAVADIAAVGADIARAAAGQLDEIQDADWTAKRYREVGERIAGLQYAVYTTIMWSGTERAADARAVGMAFGFAAHVAEDLRSEDRRLLSMPPTDLEETLALARTHVTMLRGHASPAVRRLAASLRLGRE